MRFTKLATLVLSVVATTVMLGPPAVANTKISRVVHLNFTYTDRRTCGFPISVHQFGTYRSDDFFDSSGFNYKTLLTAGGGRLTIVDTAKGTTLTMQNQTFLVFITYNSDGSIKTLTEDGLIFKFTKPGGGIVLLDTGRVVFDRRIHIVFEAGPHQDLDGDVAAYCAAFG